MAMRITNKIMQNNSLTNINTNKVLQDKLNSQMASGKKITRPSDDPVIAIRALRLRSTLSEVTQYCDKNVEDADSWLGVTEDSITSVVEVLTDMIEQCNKAVNGEKNTENRKAILDSLQALKEELYAVGNADYAGRSVFTGYRTSMELSFKNDTQKQYTITEQLDRSALEEITYIDTGGVENVTGGNYTTSGLDENSVSDKGVYRLRLSYANLDNANNAMAGTPEAKIPSIRYYDAGTNSWETVEATVVSLHDTTNNPYTYAEDPASGGVVFIPETGELILSQSMYTRLSSTKDIGATADANEGEIQITYSKSQWGKGDLRPEHYFACKSEDVDYNSDWLTGKGDDQVIAYNVGFSQSIQVNTMPDEVFTHGIGRDVDDLMNMLNQVSEMSDTVSELEALVEANPNDTAAKDNLAAANKAFTMLEEKFEKMFESGITKMQGHMDRANLALTSVGTRSSRLELVKNRLTSQKTNFKDLVTDNEQADVSEVAINLTSAEFSYNAALMATGKVMQNSLMNFI